MSYVQDRVTNLDACIKCSACTAQCPVAAVYPLFPGPKSVGPDAERFRLEGVEMDPCYLDYCSNCKTCEVTCPSGVKITSMILSAREKAFTLGKTKWETREKTTCKFKRKDLQYRVRDLVLGRAEYLGRVGAIWPGLTNTVTGVPLVRGLLERTLGISRQAPLPAYLPKFKGVAIRRQSMEVTRKHKISSERSELVQLKLNIGTSVADSTPTEAEYGVPLPLVEVGVSRLDEQGNENLTGERLLKRKVVYFPGCFVTYNDALTGQAVVKVLEHNGYEVIVPTFRCCGVPLQANGHFSEARDNARKNLALMDPYLQAEVPVITACTSCGLALKEEYPNMEALGAERIGQQVYDLFEFLWQLHERRELREDFRKVPVSLGYHAPCHLKAQGVGTPSMRILRLIPGVSVNDLDAGCCGLSGSFGFKQEKYDLAMQIGSSLFNRVQHGVTNGEFQIMTTECGGCQVQIQHGSGVKIEHPVWVVMKAYGLEVNH